MNTALNHILKIAEAISKPGARAIETADILEGQFERFQATDVNFTYYIFTVLRLWQLGGDTDRALKWLERASPHLSHPRLELLFYIWFYSEQGRFDLAEEWLDKALEVTPEHPEVLTAGFVVHYHLQNHQQALHFAKTLFEMVHTRQTVGQYLTALWNTNQLEKILEILNTVDEVELSEQYIHENRARSLIRLNRLVDARDDLEWIRGNGLAQPFYLLYLGGSYQLLGDDDQAITIFRECINQFPAEAEAYLALSHVYLHVGRLGESFNWALKAAQIFPDDPRTALHLWFISHPTGKELLSEVGDAFRAFFPGGKFADQGPFIRISMDELPEMWRDWQEKGTDLTNVYQAGRITWLMLCTWRNVSPFRAHYEMTVHGGAQYVAHSEQLQDIAKLMENCPREIVLDYTAWLTVWSLFGAESLNILSRYFDRVWVPHALRAFLVEEQNRLTTFGQLTRYRAQCAVRDVLDRWRDKIIWHDEVGLEEGRDVSGSHTEKAIAQQNNLVYLNEHLASNESVPETAIGIAAIADLLAHTGEIDTLAQQNLKRHRHPVKDEELLLVSRLHEEREVVISVFTLDSWAMYAELDPLFGYFARIHLAEPARKILLNEIAAYEFGQRILDAFREMRQLLREGETSNLIVFEAIPEKEYVNHRLIQEREVTESDEQEELDLTRQIFLDYYDELVGIASRQNIPVWTDDRLTKILNIEGRYPPFTFGTDSFLAFAHNHPGTAETITQEQYHTYYDKLVAWGYHFLPINPEHMLWHLQRGIDVHSKPLTKLFQHYRGKVIGFWEFVKNAPDVNKQLGVELLGAYQQQLIVTLYRLYSEGIPVDVGSSLFAELDLSRHAGALVWGNEPTFFASLFMHAITADVASSESGQQGTPPSERLLDFSHWLNLVILRSGVPFEILDEAWYQFIHYPLALLDEAQDDSQRQIGLIYLDRMLHLVPDHTIAYLLSTDIGSRLQGEFGLQIQELVTFQVDQEPGDPLEFRLPVKEWNRDFQLAIAKYLEEPTQEAITVGQVTLKAEQVAPGSIFLKAQVIPTEAYEQFPNLRVPTQIICLLPGFTNPDGSHRETLWKIGLDALQRHQVSTDSWATMQKRFLQDDNEGVKAGNIARQQLLGEWPVAKEYLALAARLNIGSILQVLNAIEPEVVRGWLQIPRLDWTSVDALASWANQIPLSVDSVSNGHKFVENSILFGYSIFPDTLIVRQRALSLLLDLTHTAQHGAIQQLLSSAEVSASLALKASVVLMVHDWLNGRRANGLNEGEHLTSYKERHDALIIRVLQGWTVEDDYQATITQLEALLCRWLYRAWSIDDSRFREELAYLAFVGAGFVMDTLAVAGQISSSVVRDITHRLLSDIKSGPIHSRSELQLNGFFHPVLGTSLNYAASYLLHGLLSSEAYLPEYHTQPLLKEVALQCGVSHRIQQAFLGSNQLESAWLDSELVTDIGSACTKVLGGLSESDIEKWSELDRYRIIVAASQEAVGVLAQQMTRAIATQETEAEIMGSLTTLFQGKMHPTPIWYETLSILLEPDVLEKIHKFAQSYGEVVANFVLILIQQDANCPSELRDTIGDFLLEVPTSVNTAELIKAKAYVFSQLLHSSLDIALVCKWIQNVAADDQLDGSTVRLAFRPFILMWQDFGAEVRKSLFDTLMEIAVMPKYKGLWEFARLTRVQESFDM